MTFSVVDFVCEAMQFMQRERARSHMAKHHAARTGTEVDRQIRAFLRGRLHTMPEPVLSAAGRSFALAAR